MSEEPAHSPKGASSAWHPKYPYLNVRSNGDIFSYLSCRVLKPRPDKDGYMLVTFGPRPRQVTAKVHRLVLEAFVGFSKEECDHKDRNRANNAFDNLQYTSVAKNRRNVGVRRHSRSQIRNVRQLRNGRWQAYCTQGGRYKSLGCFATAEEASHVAETRYAG